MAKNRAVPSHWQGALVLRQEESQTATIVERAVRLLLLVPLPIDRKAPYCAWRKRVEDCQSA